MFDLAVDGKSLETLVRELVKMEDRLKRKFGFTTAVRLKVVVYNRDGSMISEEAVGEWNLSLAGWMQRFMGRRSLE